MIVRETEPCWIVKCDGCGELLGNDEYGFVHFEAHEEAVEHCASYDWQIARDKDGLVTGVLCATCYEEGKPTEGEGPNA